VPEKLDLWQWIVGICTPPFLVAVAWVNRIRSTVTKHSGDIKTLLILTQKQAEDLAQHIVEDRDQHERVAKLETHVEHIRQDTQQILTMLRSERG